MGSHSFELTWDLDMDYKKEDSNYKELTLNSMTRNSIKDYMIRSGVRVLSHTFMTPGVWTEKVQEYCFTCVDLNP